MEVVPYNLRADWVCEIRLRLVARIGRMEAPPTPLAMPPAGLEPATAGLEIPCSIRLSYRGPVAVTAGPALGE